MQQPTVMLVNNEPTFRWTISRLLESQGFAVATHHRDAAVADCIRDSQPAAVVLETTYGSATTATSIVEQVRSHRSTRYTPIIVCSPEAAFLNSYGEYLRGHGCVVIGRPFNEDQFIELVHRVADTPLPLSDAVAAGHAYHSVS